ncbi:hypothetical protein E2320_019599 [Naja naja]|nr:hypothetical protein E2320_019599 [Naja naja]
MDTIFLSVWLLRLIYPRLSEEPSRHPHIQAEVSGSSVITTPSCNQITLSSTYKVDQHKRLEEGKLLISDYIKAKQQQDPYTRAWKDELKKDQQNTLSPFTMAGGQLLHNGCLYVPLPLREEVLQLYHDNKTAGHREIFRIQQRALREFWWPCIQGGIRDYPTGLEPLNIPTRQILGHSLSRFHYRSFSSAGIHYHTGSTGFICPIGPFHSLQGSSKSPRNSSMSLNIGD